MDPGTANRVPLAAAATGALVLTATRRLERRLRRLFDLEMERKGQTAWISPAIHSADGWLLRALESLGEGWRLLGAPAARHLWERIIEVDCGERVLLQSGTAARLAEEAHALLAEYRRDPSRYPLTTDHATFLRWRERYLETCRRHDWVDSAGLADAVSAAVADGRLSVPEEVWLVGFDDQPPRFQRLVQAFAGRGVKARFELPPTSPSGDLVRVAADDPRDEVRQAALWARRLLESGEGEIGIVVPDLARYRPLLERILREEIDPVAQVRPGHDEVRFNLSLGLPFAGTGPISSALALLGTGGTLPLADIGFFLRSPYLGGSLREAHERAVFEGKLRTWGKDPVSLAFLAEGKEGASPGITIFRRLCTQLKSAVYDRRLLHPGGWVREFVHLLAAVGWPGERPLDSHDFQVVKGWREKVLSQMAAFDLVAGAVPRGEAVALLRRLSAETLFQPEGGESPVQVMGLLETSGLRFGHLWVMGLHDGALPTPPRPNPFLPAPLQVEAGMPHADAGRETVFARRVAERLFAAAPRVVLSHPRRDGDAPLRPSPLIRAVPEREVERPPSRAPIAVWRASHTAAEQYFDGCGPPLPGGTLVAGGTSILRDQALCPFRAFARHRLAALALEVPGLGLDPGERGSLLHKVMELFWRDTRDQAAFLALDAETLESRLRQTIAAAVEAVYARLPRPAGELLRLEQERLFLLVREWLLEVEAKRPPFSVVEEEEKRTAIFGGLEISCRIDRLDRLEGGQLAVIDYKTGLAEAADLVGERLLEPQLAIYGVGREEEGLAAVAFATLRRGKCAFAGVARDAGLLPKVPAVEGLSRARELGIADWKMLLSAWREQLHDLGRAFADGEAAVDPVGEKACRYCDLIPLCRLNESRPVPGDGGEE